MIRHIFKIIWNERKTNAWIVLEYILVFCVLWFCVDYLYYMGKCYWEPVGFDTKNTYLIEMQKRPDTPSNNTEGNGETEKVDKPALAQTLLNRVKNYPGVENVCFSKWAAPFDRSSYMSGYYIDEDTTHNVTFRLRWVSESFFDVFKINTTAKELSGWGAPGSNQILITPNRKGLFGNDEYSVPLENVKKTDFIHRRQKGAYGHRDRRKNERRLFQLVFL